VRDAGCQCIHYLFTNVVFIRYTTVSQPECVDGWLGMQLSDKLWFPCWNHKVMSDSAARMIPLIAFQDHAASLQPATSAPSLNSSQALHASPRNAATPTAALPLDGSAGQHAPSFANAHSGPAAVDPSALEKVVAGLQLRLEELQVENRALAALSAATHSSRRSADPPAAVSDADAGRMHSIVQALLASNRAMQDSFQSNLQVLQESLISNQCSLKEALAASHLQVASAQAAAAQTHNFALAFAAGCLALLAVVIARGRV